MLRPRVRKSSLFLTPSLERHFPGGALRQSIVDRVGRTAAIGEREGDAWMLITTVDKHEIVRTLCALPGMQNFDARSQLLTDVRPTVARIQTSSPGDLLSMVSQIVTADPASILVLLDNATLLAGEGELTNKVRSWKQHVSSALQHAATAVAQSGVGAESTREANLSKLGVQDFSSWNESLLAIGRRIARLTIGNDAQGTAFLVGPDVALTNYHVVEPFIGVADVARTVRLHFDRGVTSKPREPVSLADEWLLDFSPYPTAGDLTPDKLDYALIQLKPGAVTEQGWIRINGDLPGIIVASPLFVVQHANGGALGLAVDVVQSVNPSQTVVRYRTDTEHGSSGSPCFDARLRPVALHRAGNKAGGFNEGAVIRTVVDRIRSGKRFSALGS